VWIYAMGAGPLRFVKPPYYEPWHGAVLLAVWTLIPPMFLARAADAGLQPHRRRAAGRTRGPARSRRS